MDEWERQIMYYQAVAVALLDIEREQRESRRRQRLGRSCWTKDWFLKRHSLSHTSLLRHIRVKYPNDYRNFMRMTEGMFQELLQMVTPYIGRQDTVMRQSISAHDRLVATLRYLVTGATLEELKFNTLISPQALGVIIPETCHAIYNVLRKEYLKFPSNEADWQEVARGFEEHWHFPNCGGAIDGKHIRIMAPKKSGSLYFNYKGYFSIVLMAVVNANYEFIFVDVGKNGRASDGGSLKDTEFYRRLVTDNLNLPKAEDCREGLNFVFVADEAFALHEHIMKPFPHRNLTTEKRIFNYRLSRARRIVENAFGIMSSRFRIFHTPIGLKVEKTEWVVLACCVLHNFIRRKNTLQNPPRPVAISSDATCLPNEPPIPIAPMSALDQTHMPANPSAKAKKVREDYMNYFNGVGANQWQYAYI